MYRQQQFINFLNVVVRIHGGPMFPWVSTVNFVRWRPGITVYEALSRSGVAFIGNQIINVGGIPIGQQWGAEITLNGRLIPPQLISTRLRPFDELVVSIVAIPTPF